MKKVLKIVEVERELVEEGLRLKMRHSDLTHEYNQLSKIILDARSRKTKISREKDEIFTKLYDVLERMNK